jgi:RimJ/RimL family protein N-acetyltransferase
MIVLLPSISSPPEEEGTVIGLSGFGGIDEIEKDGVKKRFADVGAMLDPEYRGNGYAVEAFRLSIEFALSELGLMGLVIKCWRGMCRWLVWLRRSLGGRG